MFNINDVIKLFNPKKNNSIIERTADGYTWVSNTYAAFKLNPYEWLQFQGKWNSKYPKQAITTDFTTSLCVQDFTTSLCVQVINGNQCNVTDRLPISNLIESIGDGKTFTVTKFTYDGEYRLLVADRVVKVIQEKYWKPVNGCTTEVTVSGDLCKFYSGPELIAICACVRMKEEEFDKELKLLQGISVWDWTAEHMKI